MSSESKKRKQVSMYCDGSSLKWKGGRCKRVKFYNSAQRQQEKMTVIMEASTEELTDEQIYELQSSERDYCEMYEPTYNPEDGSM